MNTNNVKKYAPKARKAFIEAMSKQAAKYGITKKKIEPAEQKGDLVLIGDRPFPASVIKPRERLVKRIEQQGFDQVMEHVAYSWFNRLCAIRYMERKGFLDHGRRVLSAADGSAGVPQILEECLDVELPGLDQAKVRELKLDGTKDEELYRELLLAQCHALHQAMPFLFEAVADESELLLPENLTKTDSLIRDLVASVPDEDWDHIEIIGWLYQFYISEKKDQVMGKVVKSEDIPAATQLFTPNWIVQYLVQNSVGRQWLQTYPDSPLKDKMPYYIEPAEQTPEVKEQLAEITPSEIAPESIKVLDPAAGSGHILVEAYKVLKAIYEERGYRTRDIPQLILENNLFGLDIDDRAGQLAGFALMMLAREDDRRIFSRNIRLNVLSLQDSANVNLPSLWQSLNFTGEWQGGTSRGLFEEDQKDLSAFAADNRYQLLQRTLEKFKQAKTFGSLIEVSLEDYEGLKEIFVTLCELERDGDSMQKMAATQLLPYIHQAVLLAQKYDYVVANPPYMGSKGMNADLKAFAKKMYPNSKSDLFSCMKERMFRLLKELGLNSTIVMESWMFLSSYQSFRESIVKERTIYDLIHMPYSGRGRTPLGINFGTSASIISKKHIRGFRGHFSCIRFNEIDENGIPFQFPCKNERQNIAVIDQFNQITGSPVAYWLNDNVFGLFKNDSCGERIKSCQGMATTDNSKFMRNWYELSVENIGFGLSREEAASSGKRWFPYNKGGVLRKWYGNHLHVVDWLNEGQAIKASANVKYPYLNGNISYVVKEQNPYFQPSVSWTDLTSKGLSSRFYPKGFLFDVSGHSAFPKDEVEALKLLSFLNSSIGDYLAKTLNSSFHFQVGDFRNLPYVLDSKCAELNLDLTRKAIEISKYDWEKNEICWDYRCSPIIETSGTGLISDACKGLMHITNESVVNLRSIETSINANWNGEYDLEGIVETSVKAEEITLTYNLDRDGADETQSLYFCELISYSIGCMMGRYSLDREGLVYAHSGNEGFGDLISEGAYKTFSADDDGIIPITDQEWFSDDATNRFREFVKVVWGDEHLHENLDFVAESLCLHAIKPKKSESSIDTIRRYLSTQFYKDHLKTYKKRPIYWLFSSGKQKAFECLVYLHRYNEGTLARMRTEYVIPLTAKMAAYAQKLENDKEASGSAAEVKRLEKEIAQLHKQQAELSEFDEKLRHYADQRISLNLDDGVKVNYGKFGDLLAEVKAITGEAPEALS
ncbi:MAG: BREX-1 system adenine-specific DNA-methyltransferase PglX [Oceanospirillaceae bacterium]|nr:BREX-1 system adenine-specific DNA-methyltransferase PglX [Oceanospirillaceae bacterium]